MKFGHYLARIPQGIEDGTGYVKMKHGTKYQVQLKNEYYLPCAVKLEIDGKEQGVWKLDSFQSATLERPVHDSGHFTFYKLDSAEGNAIALTKDSNLGLIKVTFTPKKEPTKVQEITRSYGRGQSLSLESYSPETTRGTKGLSAGGTGLSGQSNQEYGTTDGFDLDYSKEIIINLRLICDESADIDQPRPLTRSNPVPPPVY